MKSPGIICQRSLRLITELQLAGDIDTLRRVLNLPQVISMFHTFYGEPGRQAIGSSPTIINRFHQEELRKLR
jgi:hypothetical protein